MVNTILAKRVNHIVAKGDHPVWPKGSKSHGFSNLEKLEPYEGKPSCTVLRGEEGSNALDLPDRPSDLQQRDGRGIRKGNEVAKLYADNKVDVIIYRGGEALCR